MSKCGSKYLRCKKLLKSAKQANPRAPSQYLVLFCSKLQFSECTNTFSMESMSWVCMMMGDHIVYTHVGGKKCYLVCWASNIEF